MKKIELKRTKENTIITFPDDREMFLDWYEWMTNTFMYCYGSKNTWKFLRDSKIDGHVFFKKSGELPFPEKTKFKDLDMCIDMRNVEDVAVIITITIDNASFDKFDLVINPYSKNGMFGSVMNLLPF